MTSEEVRLECLREAVKLCTQQIVLRDGGTLTFTEPLLLAKQFAGFVFGFEWDEEEGEYIEPEEDDDDSKLLAAVRAFDDEGKEL